MVIASSDGLCRKASSRKRDRYKPLKTGLLGRTLRNKNPAHFGAIIAALALTACGTPTRPALTQAFPPAPVDLKSPLPAASQLPPTATLRDIMSAHLKDSEALQELSAEVGTWRAWWQAQKDALDKP